MATSRAELRRDIGAHFGVRTATATAGGTTTQFTDIERLAVENAHLRGRVALFVAGTAANLGQQRRIDGNAKSTGTVTFARALPAATAIDDQIEVWGEHGVGPVPDDVHAAIDRALASVSALAPVAAVSTPVAFSWGAPTVAVPAGWVRVAGVEWETADGLWRSVPPADVRVDRPSRTVELTGVSRDLAEAGRVRLHGATAPAALASDAATTDVDRTYLVQRAAGELWLAIAPRHFDPVAAERKADGFFARAAAREAYARAPSANRFGMDVRL